MEKFTAGLEGISHRLSQRLGSIMPGIPGRQLSRLDSELSTTSRLQSSDDFDEEPPEYGVDFEVEEEQVMKGLELVYQDKLNEADEYFETLKAGHARFSLHHAEVSTYVALMTFDPEDIAFATMLLKETTSLATQQGRRWRTHSKLKKVAEAAQETVDAMKTWALKSAATALSIAGPAGAQASARIMPVDNPDIPDDEDDADITNFNHMKEAESSKRGEVAVHHRARRMRLWALLIQGECHLMTSLLQVVEAGESWTAVVKMGFNLKRTWSIYQHCENKLKKIQSEWVALGGTFTGGDLEPNMNVDYDSDEETELALDKLRQGKAMTSRSGRRSQNYDPILAPPTGEMVYEGVRAAAGNLEKIQDDVREDQELASLRIGVQFGIGAFNLMISLIPINYQKAIELMGVPADRNQGLVTLRKVSGLHHCRAPLAAIVLLQYYTVIMGLLPYCEENAIGAQNVINMLPIAWNESSIFGILQARLASYVGRLGVATSALEKLANAMAKGSHEGGLIVKLRNMIVDEFGWALFLQGNFVGANEKFGVLYKETRYFKPLFAFLQAACYWEADEKYHHDAAKILRDIPGMVASKGSTPTAMEQFAMRIANDFIQNGQVPLFPALETIAVYNGFHHMDKVTLKHHMDRIGDALMSHGQQRSSNHEEAEQLHESPTIVSKTHASGSSNVGQVITGHRKIAFQSKSIIPDPEDDVDDSTPVLLRNPTRVTIGGGKFEHTWTKQSKVLCRYLLALCQRSLGDTKQAESNFRYVVNQSDVPPGNILPYACFEWGSLLLSMEATTPEGLNLLEKSINFPPHEFQTRLKFVVSERLRMFRRSCESDLTSQDTMTSALNLRRVSELLRTVSVKETRSSMSS